MAKRVSIKFLGAASTVTGSKHLLKTPEKNILIDCGLFQGIKSLRKKNWEPLPVAVKDIDLVILTHAHLDHCGYLPLLVKSGYTGRIWMTPPTKDLVEIILRDSAKIQEEDAMHANKHGYSKHKPALPLYTIEDVEKVLGQIDVYSDNEWNSISNHIKFRFVKNGHILGSSFIQLDCFGKMIVFSGDIGTSGSLIMNGPTQIDNADYIVMESTYGDRLHRREKIRPELADIIKDVVHKGGKLLIPSFAVGRAQEIMILINELKKQGSIPNIPLYMDSPMSVNATDIFMKYPKWHKLSDKECHDAFANTTFVTDPKETKKIINNPDSKIVIASSGMLTGGRVLGYLERYVGESENTILLVGYQAEGTRGRALREGADEIKMHGKYFEVKANIREITSLSAHADQREMMDWLHGFKNKPKEIILVHGERNAQEAFRVKIENDFNIEVLIPQQNDELALFEVNL